MITDRHRLYVIIDSYREDADHMRIMRDVIEGGADMVQMRLKETRRREKIVLGKKMASLAKEKGVLFIVNDDLDVAVITGAHGVHLGQDDIPIEDARSFLDRAGIKEFMIGVSTHSAAQAADAQARGADYIGVGPIFRTRAKADYEPRGVELISEVSSTIRIPFFAIGGIDAENVEKVVGSGAGRIAVIGAVFKGPDVRTSTRKLKSRMEVLSGI